MILVVGCIGKQSCFVIQKALLTLLCLLDSLSPLLSNFRPAFRLYLRNFRPPISFTFAANTNTTNPSSGKTLNFVTLDRINFTIWTDHDLSNQFDQIPMAYSLAKLLQALPRVPCSITIAMIILSLHSSHNCIFTLS